MRWMQRERRGAKGLKIQLVGVGLVVVRDGRGEREGLFTAVNQ